MNTGGEAAEQIVRMSLEGIEVAAKISGAGAKNIAALLYALLKEEKKTRGKARLAPMLRSGKELKVFTIKRENLKKFTKEAKKYGVLYRVLLDRGDKSPGAEADIIARAEDASKISRIVERFHLSSVDKASIVTEPEMARNAESNAPETDIDAQKLSEKEELLDALMGKPEGTEELRPNFSEAETGIPFPSEPGSGLSGRSGGAEFVADRKKIEKPSVREAIQEIRKSRQRQRNSTPFVSGKRAVTDQATKKRNQTVRRPGRRQSPKRGKPGKTKGAR